MAEPVTSQRILEHVQRLGEEHPPIELDSVDRGIRDPRAVAERYGHVIDYLARVELEALGFARVCTVSGRYVR